MECKIYSIWFSYTEFTLSTAIKAKARQGVTQNILSIKIMKYFYLVHELEQSFKDLYTDSRPYSLLQEPIDTSWKLGGRRAYSSAKMDWGNLFQNWDVRTKKLLDRLTVRLRSIWTQELFEAEAARIALRKTFPFGTHSDRLVTWCFLK